MIMRTLAVSLFLVIAVVIAGRALAIDTERRRWSQFCEHNRVAKGDFKDTFDSFNSRIKVLGSEGWELVTLTLSDDDTHSRYAACFKKETR